MGQELCPNFLSNGLCELTRRKRLGELEQQSVAITVGVNSALRLQLLRRQLTDPKEKEKDKEREKRSGKEKETEKENDRVDGSRRSTVSFYR